MPFIRKNIYTLGAGWNDTVLWYARGVAAMQAKPIADRTSWGFFGAMHGIDEGLWQELGYLPQGTTLPSQSDQDVFWNQCQHQSWYFLPWHRGYLLAIEAILRAHIVALGGPADWALPYWNYSKPNQFKLPTAFASPDWPDGTGNNPLFVAARYGPNDDGNVYVPQNQINLNALGMPKFTGTGGGGSPGFGGVDTPFSHSGNVSGGIENQPHNYVHGLVGGGNNTTNLPGLMSDPDTAALDPIFWLHHANIDRLWEVWRLHPTSHVDPNDADWIKGPPNAGGREFVMPNPDGSEWVYTPGELSNIATLTYSYDDTSAPTGLLIRGAARRTRLGMAPTSIRLESTMAPPATELMGANAGALRLDSGIVDTQVHLDAPVRAKVNKSLTEESVTVAEPDRVYLNLENVRGANDAAAFSVYINLPEGAVPEEHPEFLAGSIGLFGVRKASLADGAHGGNGITYVLDITDIVDALHLQAGFDASALHVKIVPLKDSRTNASITVDRISVFREGE